MNNRKEVEQHIKEILENIFKDPPYPDLNITPSEESLTKNLLFSIDWELSNDTQNPRSSKIINLKISTKMIDEYYLKSSKNGIKEVDKKLKNFIEGKLKEFNPAPTTEYDYEVWDFTTDEILNTNYTGITQKQKKEPDKNTKNP